MKQRRAKPRESKLGRLTAPQKAKLAEWLRNGVRSEGGILNSYTAVAAMILREFGIAVGRTTLAAYYRAEVAPAAIKASQAQRAIDAARLGGAMRSLRLFQGLTLEGVRTASGLSEIELRRAESGASEIAPAALRSIELALGVSPGWLARAAYEN